MPCDGHFDMSSITSVEEASLGLVSPRLLLAKYVILYGTFGGLVMKMVPNHLFMLER